MIRPWEYKYGDKTIKVTAQDVEEALRVAISCVLKETETNRQLKENVQMKLLYEHHMNVLSVTKAHFSGAIEEDRKKNLRPQIPGKKTVNEGG